MAYLYYGADPRPAEIPDHVLAHVKVVAATKLRRGECFMLTWRHSGEGAEEARTSVWMQPSIPLRFVFDGPEPEALDRQYLRDLADEAMSSRGIVLEWGDQEAREAHSGEAPPITAVAA
ncbi:MULTISPECIES: hypothetical protein [Microbacterium]|uniref:DUF7882 family protein n=1 Tax=Microbacterium TaxID=33882 RepID=UPI001888D737|nr:MULTISPECIES: hypothetical protein [Microbacterium]